MSWTSPAFWNLNGVTWTKRLGTVACWKWLPRKKSQIPGLKQHPFSGKPQILNFLSGKNTAQVFSQTISSTGKGETQRGRLDCCEGEGSDLIPQKVWDLLSCIPQQLWFVGIQKVITYRKACSHHDDVKDFFFLFFFFESFTDLSASLIMGVSGAFFCACWTHGCNQADFSYILV